MTRVVLPELARRGFDVRDPQVQLRDGKISLTAAYDAGLFTIHPRVVMTVGVQNGRPVVRTESADFGPIPVPQMLIDQITQSVNETLAAEIPPEVTLTEVIVANGQLTVVGASAQP
jgi:uncharacterized protein YdgA (DUF945 family)